MDEFQRKLLETLNDISEQLHVIATNMEKPEIKISKEEIGKSVNSALERAIRDIDEESQQKQKRTFQT